MQFIIISALCMMFSTSTVKAGQCFTVSSWTEGSNYNKKCSGSTSYCLTTDSCIPNGEPLCPQCKYDDFPDLYYCEQNGKEECCDYDCGSTDACEATDNYDEGEQSSSQCRRSDRNYCASKDECIEQNIGKTCPICPDNKPNWCQLIGGGVCCSELNDDCTNYPTPRPTYSPRPTYRPSYSPKPSYFRCGDNKNSGPRGDIQCYDDSVCCEGFKCKYDKRKCVPINKKNCQCEDVNNWIEPEINLNQCGWKVANNYCESSGECLESGQQCADCPNNKPYFCRNYGGGQCCDSLDQKCLNYDTYFDMGSAAYASDGETDNESSDDGYSGTCYSIFEYVRGVENIEQCGDMGSTGLVYCENTGKCTREADCPQCGSDNELGDTEYCSVNGEDQCCDSGCPNDVSSGGNDKNNEDGKNKNNGKNNNDKNNDRNYDYCKKDSDCYSYCDYSRNNGNNNDYYKNNGNAWCDNNDRCVCSNGKNNKAMEIDLNDIDSDDLDDDLDNIDSDEIFSGHNYKNNNDKNKNNKGNNGGNNNKYKAMSVGSQSGYCQTIESYTQGVNDYNKCRGSTVYCESTDECIGIGQATCPTCRRRNDIICSINGDDSCCNYDECPLIDDECTQPNTYTEGVSGSSKCGSKENWCPSTGKCLSSNAGKTCPICPTNKGTWCQKMGGGCCSALSESELEDDCSWTNTYSSAMAVSGKKDGNDNYDKNNDNNNGKNNDDNDKNNKGNNGNNYNSDYCKKDSDCYSYCDDYGYNNNGKNNNNNDAWCDNNDRCVCNNDGKNNKYNALGNQNRYDNNGNYYDRNYNDRHNYGGNYNKHNDRRNNYYKNDRNYYNDRNYNDRNYRGYPRAKGSKGGEIKNEIEVLATATLLSADSGVDGTVKIDENGNVFVDLDIASLDTSVCNFNNNQDVELQYFLYDSFEYNDLKSRQGDQCTNDIIGNIYDPFDTSLCSEYNGDGDKYFNCKIGDLSGRFGYAKVDDNNKIKTEGNISQNGDGKEGGFCGARLTPEEMYTRSVVFVCNDDEKTVVFCAPFEVSAEEI